MLTSGQIAARAQAEARKGFSDSIEATCLSVDWSARLATVDIGGASRVMPWAGPAPQIGDTVRVITAGQKPICWAQYGSPTGEVLAVGGTTVTVEGEDGRQYTYPFVDGVSLLVGDIVRLDHAGRIVLGQYAAASTIPEVIRPPAPPAQSVFKRTFYPTDSGRYFNGVYSSQFVDASSNQAGYYWYGTQIASSIPDTATVTRAELRLVERFDNLPGIASRLGIHNNPSTRHGNTAPALSGIINVSNGGVINIASYATALKTGTAYGVGFYAGFGWRQFDTYARSGSIYMEWTL